MHFRLTDRQAAALEAVQGAPLGIRVRAFAEAMWSTRPAWQVPAKQHAAVARAGRWLAELAGDGYIDISYDAKGARYALSRAGTAALDERYRIPPMLG